MRCIFLLSHFKLSPHAHIFGRTRIMTRESDRCVRGEHSPQFPTGLLIASVDRSLCVVPPGSIQEEAPDCSVTASACSARGIHICARYRLRHHLCHNWVAAAAAQAFALNTQGELY